MEKTECELNMRNPEVKVVERENSMVERMRERERDENSEKEKQEREKYERGS